MANLWKDGGHEVLQKWYTKVFANYQWKTFFFCLQQGLGRKWRKTRSCNFTLCKDSASSEEESRVRIQVQRYNWKLTGPYNTNIACCYCSNINRIRHERICLTNSQHLMSYMLQYHFLTWKNVIIIVLYVILSSAFMDGSVLWGWMGLCCL